LDGLQLASPPGVTPVELEPVVSLRPQPAHPLHRFGDDRLFVHSAEGLG
jgi:hypothetical protein